MTKTKEELAKVSINLLEVDNEQIPAQEREVVSIDAPEFTKLLKSLAEKPIKGILGQYTDPDVYYPENLITGGLDLFREGRSFNIKDTIFLLNPAGRIKYMSGKGTEKNVYLNKISSHYRYYNDKIDLTAFLYSFTQALDNFDTLIDHSLISDFEWRSLHPENIMKAKGPLRINSYSLRETLSSLKDKGDPVGALITGKATKIKRDRRLPKIIRVDDDIIQPNVFYTLPEVNGSFSWIRVGDREIKETLSKNLSTGEIIFDIDVVVNLGVYIFEDFNSHRIYLENEDAADD